MAARMGRRIITTPSGYSLRDVVPETVVTVDEQGRIVEGPRPTKDLDMHLKVLNARPDINVVCHTHGTDTVAASTMLKPGPNTLPPLTPGFVYYAHPLPMLPFLVPGSEPLAEAVVKGICKGKGRALLLQNHGLVTLGRDLRQAVNIAEEIEEAARIFVITGGKAAAIPHDKLERIG